MTNQKLRKIKKKWREKNKDKIRQYNQKFRKSHKEYERNYRRERRKYFLERLIRLKKERGGNCQICGYDEEIRILEFHHLRDKKFLISTSYWKLYRKLRKEADKCILICPNCHRKIHLT